MIELMKPYQHKVDSHITAVPFAIVDDQVEITVNKHGNLETGVMSVADFESQFASLKPE
jgi:hypothetical protein